ncbi:hypothetical protein DL98DRAFT_598273 [Cadophora sp. DSE1049]|nr:hypothetical protein DL98DRAFT_598273 [Cadophora sp. DSE1049]
MFFKTLRSRSKSSSKSTKPSTLTRILSTSSTHHHHHHTSKIPEVVISPPLSPGPESERRSSYQSQTQPRRQTQEVGEDEEERQSAEDMSRDYKEFLEKAKKEAEKEKKEAEKKAKKAREVNMSPRQELRIPLDGHGAGRWGTMIPQAGNGDENGAECTSHMPADTDIFGTAEAWNGNRTLDDEPGSAVAFHYSRFERAELARHNEQHLHDAAKSACRAVPRGEPGTVLRAVNHDIARDMDSGSIPYEVTPW